LKSHGRIFLAENGLLTPDDNAFCLLNNSVKTPGYKVSGVRSGNLIIKWTSAPFLDRLADHAVQGLDDISSIDHLADIVRIVEQRDQKGRYVKFHQKNNPPFALKYAPSEPLQAFSDKPTFLNEYGSKQNANIHACWI
jgi:hypothetical protein